MPAVHDAENRIAHLQKFRNVVLHPHFQIFHIIILGIDQQILVKAGRIRRKDTAVGLPIGQHHPQIAQGVLLIRGIPRSLGQHDHGIIVDPIVIPCRLLRELPVLIAVDTFLQIAIRRSRHLLTLKKPAAGHQHGGYGPAMIRRVKAALQ